MSSIDFWIALGVASAAMGAGVLTGVDGVGASLDWETSVGAGSSDSCNQ